MHRPNSRPRLGRYPAPTAIEWADLAEPELLLAKILEDLGFGRIECLTVRDGKPLLQPPPRVIARFNTAEPPNPTGAEAPQHLGLRRPLIRLFELMRQIENGTLLLIHVKDGLPLTVEVERRFVED